MSSERVVEVKKKGDWSLIIAGSGIFAAMSLALSFLAPFLPRVQWGLALFDPVSIVWILAFFIFGYKAGLITSLIGMLLLMPFDSFAPIGPTMKFVATAILIVIPLIVNKIRRIPKESNAVLNKKSLALNWVISLIVRLGVMLILNILVFIVLRAEFIQFIDLAFLGLPQITGWTAIYITVIFINTLQSIWDYLVPYMITAIVKTQRSLPW